MTEKNYFLTDAEWDACFYQFFTHRRKTPKINFFVSMQKSLMEMFLEGYLCEGINNSHDVALSHLKVANLGRNKLFLGNPDKLDPIILTKNGRDMLKRVAPKLVTENDEQWEEQWKTAMDWRKKQEEEAAKKAEEKK